MTVFSKISELAGKVQKLSTWENTKDIFGIESNSKDYIFEFFCAVKILNDLKANYNIEICEKKGKKKIIKFPMKPGNKKNFSYFKLKRVISKTEVEEYQFCLGTNIILSKYNGTTIAPDISIQKGTASLNPTEHDVISVYDSKFSIKEDTKIAISTIREFAMIVQDLEVKEYNSIKFKDYTELRTNCLLTNGGVSTDHENYCLGHYIKQVGGLGIIGKKEEYCPTLEEEKRYLLLETIVYLDTDSSKDAD